MSGDLGQSVLCYDFIPVSLVPSPTNTDFTLRHNRQMYFNKDSQIRKEKNLRMKMRVSGLVLGSPRRG